VPVSTAVKAFADMLASNTTHPVVIGRPTTRRGAITIMAWKYDEDAAVRRPIDPLPEPMLLIRIAVICGAASTPDALARFDTVVSAIAGTPVLTDESSQIQVRADEIPVDQLIALASALQIPLALWYPVLLRVIPSVG
jgi:hypothetical protein